VSRHRPAARPHEHGDSSRHDRDSGEITGSLEETEKKEQQQGPAAAFTEGALQDLMRTLEAAGWRKTQLAVARKDPTRARAWLAHAEEHATSNPGGYAWAGFDSGEAPAANGVGSPKVPLDIVLTTWMRNVGRHYHDWSTCEDEIAESEQRRGQELGFEARQALFELWNELHVPFEVES